MKFSQQLWKAIEPVYAEILELPFNKELINGELSVDRFVFYLKQDSYYLADFTRALSMIGVRSSDMNHVESFLGFALGAVKVERALHESYFQEYSVPADIEKSPTCFNYTNFILNKAALDSVTAGMAGVLPCFWIYREVGHYINERTISNNPYQEWISTYSSEQFSNDVDRAIEIVDEVASQQTKDERSRMVDTFIYSTKLEWMFWDSAYRMEKWPPHNK